MGIQIYSAKEAVLMLDYFPDLKTPVPEDALYRYCKDEMLDYPYTVSCMKEKRPKKRKHKISFTALLNKLRFRSVISGQHCTHKSQ
jgi:hypothetical protein